MFDSVSIGFYRAVIGFHAWVKWYKPSFDGLVHGKIYRKIVYVFKHQMELIYLDLNIFLLFWDLWLGHPGISMIFLSNGISICWIGNPNSLDFLHDGNTNHI
jgi:hypothetical protein